MQAFCNTCSDFHLEKIVDRSDPNFYFKMIDCSVLDEEQASIDLSDFEMVGSSSTFCHCVQVWCIKSYCSNTNMYLWVMQRRVWIMSWVYEIYLVKSGMVIKVQHWKCNYWDTRSWWNCCWSSGTRIFCCKYLSWYPFHWYGFIYSNCLKYIIVLEMECYVIFLSFVNFILSLFIILSTGGVYLYFSSESYVLMFLLF